MEMRVILPYKGSFKAGSYQHSVVENEYIFNN